MRFFLWKWKAFEAGVIEIALCRFRFFFVLALSMCTRKSVCSGLHTVYDLTYHPS